MSVITKQHGIVNWSTVERAYTGTGSFKVKRDAEYTTSTSCFGQKRKYIYVKKPAIIFRTATYRFMFAFDSLEEAEEKLVEFVQILQRGGTIDFRDDDNNSANVDATWNESSITIIE